MSLNYFDFAMGHVRLAVLRTLVEVPSSAANDSVLAMRMGELGLPVTRDQLRNQLSWLEEMGLVRLSKPITTLIVVTLRERGADVALGRSVIDGVPRPSVAH